MLGRAAGSGEVSGREVVAAAREGDDQSIALLKVLGQRLGIGIASAINVFDPDQVVIGGGVATAGELLLAPARETAWQYVLPGAGTRTEIRLARYGVESGVRGAALLAAKESARGEARLRVRPRRLPLKAEVLSVLEGLGHVVLDLGTDSTEPVDYPDVALAVGRAVTGGQAERGVLVCGSGAGVAVAANKIDGVRASTIHDTYTAHQGVEHDDITCYAWARGWSAPSWPPTSCAPMPAPPTRARSATRAAWARWRRSSAPAATPMAEPVLRERERRESRCE